MVILLFILAISVLILGIRYTKLSKEYAHSLKIILKLEERLATVTKLQEEINSLQEAKQRNRADEILAFQEAKKRRLDAHEELAHDKILNPIITKSKKLKKEQFAKAEKTSPTLLLPEGMSTLKTVNSKIKEQLKNSTRGNISDKKISYL